MKIHIKYHNQNCKIEQHGNWIDLKSAENVDMIQFQYKLINLGVSMRLPKYFQGNIVPRSGTYSKYKIIQSNHYGVIDGPTDDNDGYSGNDDVWKFGSIAFENTTIKEGDRICQFEIKPTMKAPWYIKLKWLFDNKINFIEVSDLKSKNRGGFGSTGK